MNIKNKILSFSFFICAFSFAQNGINYKAVIKDVNGNILANTSITVQFNIYEGSALTNNVYREFHTPTTDSNGLFILNIGEGTTTDVFTDINWNNDNHFLNVQLDTGSGYEDFGTTQFKTVPYASVAGNVFGLETIDEGNGVGWRLVGRNPDFHGNIGENAIDLSYSVTDSQPYGATGAISFSAGAGTIASGSYTVALGFLTDASGNWSTAIGNSTNASGGVSFAGGFNTVSSGFNAFGYGNESSAAGSYSTVFGRYTQADSRSVTVLGRYNIGGGSNVDWNSSDPLFEIGNGTSDSNRSNALTVRKNGVHVINSESTGLTINAEGFGLIIPNSGVDGIYIQAPEDDGVYIENPTDDGVSIFGSGGNGIVISNSNGSGVSIQNSGTNGILVSGSQTYGASISGDSAGIRAQATDAQNPDIILRGNSSSNTNDDGIISSDSFYSSSDIYLRSNDAVVIELDNDDNESGSFIVRNGDDDNVFTVSESGNVTMGDILRIGPIDIERNDAFSTNFTEINSSFMPSNDDEFVLGFPDNRWFRVYSVNGVTSTSDRREKKNIKNLNYGLNEVLQMQPVRFNWKNKNNPDTKLGLIAQDLQVLVPEVVHSHIWEKDKVTGILTKKELDRLGVYYSDLVPVLIKAIQEQQKIIKNEQTINTKQNLKLEALLSRIEQLESNSSN